VNRVPDVLSGAGARRTERTAAVSAVLAALWVSAAKAYSHGRGRGGEEGEGDEDQEGEGGGLHCDGGVVVVIWGEESKRGILNRKGWYRMQN
jgi:hypothetical protein